MKIIYNRLIPFPEYSAMMLFGVIFARTKYRPLPPATRNHEAIHDAQSRDCGGYLRYYWRYVRYWVRYGYRQNPFETEAYAHQAEPRYLQTRKPRTWK